tara:strand:+ start:2199 stop:2690 length:492 start_codon:yes stop_codon:yes gene_type:complete
MKYCRTLLLVSSILLSGCTTALSPKAASLSVVTSGASELTSDCLRLGKVSDSHIPPIGGNGLHQAFRKALNQAATYPNADTVAIASEHVTPTEGNKGKVELFVYDCSQKEVQFVQKAGNNPQIEAPQPQELPVKISKEIFAKAKKCQLNDGVWIDANCIMNIE